MTGLAKSPIYDQASVANPNLSNAEYLRDYITDLLKNAFPHLQPSVERRSRSRFPRSPVADTPRSSRLQVRQSVGQSSSTSETECICVD